MSKLLRDPWLGEDYPVQRERLLIIGESHYATMNGVFSQTLYDEFTKKRDSTKWIIEAHMRGEKRHIYDSLYRMLYRTKDIDVKKFWSRTGYYNFVQRPMSTIKERPTKEDVIGGFKILKDLIVQDYFDTGLMLGVSSSKYMDQFKAEIFPEAEVECTHQTPVKGSYCHIFTVTYNGTKKKLVFVRHPSRYFSWSGWHDYLKENTDLIRLADNILQD